MTYSTRRYEILENYQVALFIEDGVLKSLPVGSEGVLEIERYKKVINFEEFDTNPLYTDDEGEGM